MIEGSVHPAGRRRLGLVEQKPFLGRVAAQVALVRRRAVERVHHRLAELEVHDRSGVRRHVRERPVPAAVLKAEDRPRRRLDDVVVSRVLGLIRALVVLREYLRVFYAGVGGDGLEVQAGLRVCVVHRAVAAADVLHGSRAVVRGVRQEEPEPKRVHRHVAVAAHRQSNRSDVRPNREQELQDPSDSARLLARLLDF